MNNLKQRILDLPVDKRKFILKKLEEIKGRDQAVSKNRQPEQIAIVGISCRFPSANNPEEFWKMLERGAHGIKKTPKNRMEWPDNIDIEGKDKCLDYGGYLDDISGFDADLFRLSPREVKFMDPQQRLLLELAWETFEDAGYAPESFSGTNTGVFVGACNYDYRELLLSKVKRVASYFVTGTLECVLANRISYFFGLKGKSQMVDTGCSGSLVAMHEAISAIERGDIEQALIGGVSLMCTPTNTVAYYKTGMISKQSCCKTFSKDADGYVRGEGGGLMLIKPLSKALRDNDNIYAVVKGSAVNHGGNANSLSSPNPQSQAELIAAAFKEGNICPDTVNYIETHGTGTVIGDPLEIEGLKIAFDDMNGFYGKSSDKKKYCLLSSAKTNIGHLEAASGIAGLVKIAKSMQHKKITKILNFTQINPHIDINDSPFAIATESKQWNRIIDKSGNTVPRRAGVSSFGLGGSNGHVVLEEFLEKKARKKSDKNKPYLFTFSADSISSLKKQIKSFIEFFEKSREKINAGDILLQDIAYTLQVGRNALSVRFVVIADELDLLLSQLNEYAAGNDKVASRLPKSDNVKKMQEIAKRWMDVADINWQGEWKGKNVKRVSLPTYAFMRKRYWI